MAPGLYGRAHIGYLEPFFAGFGGEILYKPAIGQLELALISTTYEKDYDMRFDLLDYATVVSHLSFYYDAGGMFDVEVNAGRYLAGDWGATTTISVSSVAVGKLEATLHLLMCHLIPLAKDHSTRLYSLVFQ